VSSQDTGISEASTKDKKARKEGIPSGEKEVADYLRRHPDFFEDKPSLLADLRVPHHAGGAVSLLERQIQTLRESNNSRQAQLDALIQIARENDNLTDRLHDLTLQLIKCEELDVMLAIITDHLRKDFNADVVMIKLLASPLSDSATALPEMVSDVDAFCGQFQRILGSTKPYCGRLKSDQLEVLFNDRAEAIGSSAVLPLGKDGAIGLLAIGSFEPSRFTSSVDTAFLVRMADIISTALGKHLQITNN
jgi:uncharacterized protein YigA (DUF484 family)